MRTSSHSAPPPVLLSWTGIGHLFSARVPIVFTEGGLEMPQVSKLIDQVSKFIDGFCIWAIWVALKLQNILIGPLPETGEGGRGRIAQFIQFVLHYRPLLQRLAFAIAASCLFWLAGWPLAAKLALLASEIYASLLLIRFVAGEPRLGLFGKIVAAMWLPIAVIAVAIYLMFVNDQGRELGVGLMDPNQKGIFLGLALVYWALNNWLSARVGLDRAFPKPEKTQTLLFWGPRLVGVAAHLLAAVSLSFAALNQPEMQDGIQRWLVPAAPVAIVLATIFAWSLDKGFVSDRYQRDEGSVARILTYVAGVAELFVLSVLIAAWWFEVQPGFSSATFYITLSALLFLIVISWLRNTAPLCKETPSEVREENRRFERTVTIFSTLVLAAPMLGAAAAVWIWPMQVGKIFGSLTIACFSFGCFLAFTNLLDLLTSGLARYARGAGFGVAPRAIAAVFLCVLVLPAILASFHAFHRVRLCDGGECTPASKDWAAVEIPAERPDVSSAARAWYAQAERAYHSVRPKEEPVPLLIVATAGGGIRAAYWTATILERLERDLSREKLGFPEKEILTENLMRNLLFAVSGVSGGSIGAAAYAAWVHDHEINRTEQLPTSYLQEDFLAPGLAAMVFIDGPSNILPDFGQIDRGNALELGLEYASRTKNDKDGLLSHKFLSFFPAIRQDTVLQWRPALLFNGTHQETGRRIITSHLKIERDVFLDSYDALQVLNSDVRLSTAAHNSARFSYISPAGNLQSATSPIHNRGYIIDGGYFENYGALTALELARKAIDAVDPDYGKPGHRSKIKPVILQISSDPTLKEDRTLVRARRQGNGCMVSSFGPTTANPSSTDHANYLELIDSNRQSKNEGEDGYAFSPANEFSAPLIGIISVRQSHGTIAAAELAASICQGKQKVEAALQNAMQRKTTAGASDSIPTAAGGANDSPQFVHLAMCEISSNGTPLINPPLGLVLSDRTRSQFGSILRDCGNADELAALEKALGVSVQAPASYTMNSGKDAAR
jgi:hypothetical protein